MGDQQFDSEDRNVADDSFMTIKEMVKEIRIDVKAMALHIDRIDQEGSIGTKAELQDHEARLRLIEQFDFKIKGALVVLTVLTSGLAAVVLTHIHHL